MKPEEYWIYAVAENEPWQVYPFEPFVSDTGFKMRVVEYEAYRQACEYERQRCNQIQDLKAKLDCVKTTLLYLKHNNHHTIDEEMWKIDETLADLEKETK